MKKLYAKVLTLSLVAILLLVGCSPGINDEGPQDEVEDQTVTNEEENDELVLTEEELSEYDGQDGKPAYIAVDGVIYDVSNIEPWSGGSHNGYKAGLDLTEEIKTVPEHGVSKLEGLPIVGELED